MYNVCGRWYALAWIGVHTKVMRIRHCTSSVIIPCGFLNGRYMTTNSVLS